MVDNENKERATDAQVEAVIAKAREFIDLLIRFGDGREFSIARTKIEEAVMWTVRGLSD